MLKPVKFENFQDFYDNGSVCLNHQSLQRVKNIVDSNKAQLESIPDEIVQQAEEANVAQGNLEDSWANMFPQTEEARVDYNEDLQLSDGDEVLEPHQNDITGLADCDNRSDTHNHNENTTLNFGHVPYSVESVPVVDMTPILRTLNADQQDIFYYVRNWCIQVRQSLSPDPFYIYIEGSGGTGKSHLTRAVIYEARKILSRDNEDSETVGVTGPTGNAAFNISGSTIHQFLHIRGTKLPPTDLSHSMINTVRSKLATLKILIIDEISMVSHNMLTYIDARLRQIKQCSKSFGNVSIIVIGDFYQLPAVRAPSLYHCISSIYPVTSFTELFQIVTLTKIVRQENSNFAQFLNRMRTHKQDEKLSDEDMALLVERSHHLAPDDCLHVFSNNNRVNEHNETMLQKYCKNIQTILCQDFTKRAGKLIRKAKPLLTITNFNNALQPEIQLAIGAKVMLIRNIDVSNGLCNSAIGLVTAFIQGSSPSLPDAVCVKFQHATPSNDPKTITGIPYGSVAITPYEQDFEGGKYKRKQIPLKLSYASSIHKVQGFTCDEIAVSLENMFNPGMAYVALSRARSLNGLYISDLSLENTGIYCSKKVQPFLEKLPKLDFATIAPLKNNEYNLTILHLNVQSMNRHIDDVKSTYQILLSDVFFATETWLSSSSYKASIDGFQEIHMPRKNCTFYSESVNGGGISVFIRSHLTYTLLHLTATQNIESLLIAFPKLNCCILGIYRAPNFPLNVFIDSLKEIFTNPAFQNYNHKVIIGDFNEDFIRNTSKPIFTFLHENNFHQVIDKPTTTRDTLLDAIYISTNLDYAKGVLQTYFSYHEPIFITLNNIR